jgi:hypothetical protein
MNTDKIYIAADWYLSMLSASCCVHMLRTPIDAPVTPAMIKKSAVRISAASTELQFDVNTSLHRVDAPGSSLFALGMSTAASKKIGQVQTVLRPEAFAAWSDKQYETKLIEDVVRERYRVGYPPSLSVDIGDHCTPEAIRQGVPVTTAQFIVLRSHHALMQVLTSHSDPHGWTRHHEWAAISATLDLCLAYLTLGNVDSIDILRTMTCIGATLFIQDGDETRTAGPSAVVRAFGDPAYEEALYASVPLGTFDAGYPKTLSRQTQQELDAALRASANIGV